jgi:hypothetical protein
VLPDIRVAELAITGDVRSGSSDMRLVRHLNSRILMSSLKIPHCVLCLSIVVLGFEVVEGGFEGR